MIKIRRLVGQLQVRKGSRSRSLSVCLLAFSDDKSVEVMYVYLWQTEEPSTQSDWFHIIIISKFFPCIAKL